MRIDQGEKFQGRRRRWVSVYDFSKKILDVGSGYDDSYVLSDLRQVFPNSVCVKLQAAGITLACSTGRSQARHSSNTST
jgi:hypothetical protein